MNLVNFLEIEVDRTIVEHRLSGPLALVRIWEEIRDGEFDHVLAFDQRETALGMIATALLIRRLECSM